jgi:predicted metal-dependent hydrolase
VIFDRIFKLKKPLEPTTNVLQIGSRAVPLLMVHHPRARRYLLRVRPDGTVRVTIPRRGNISAARDFASRNIGWLEQQIQRMAVQPNIPVDWNLGTEILFRGEMVRIEANSETSIRFGKINCGNWPRGNCHHGSWNWHPSMELKCPASR